MGDKKRWHIVYIFFIIIFSMSIIITGCNQNRDDLSKPFSSENLSDIKSVDSSISEIFESILSESISVDSADNEIESSNFESSAVVSSDTKTEDSSSLSSVSQTSGNNVQIGVLLMNKPLHGSVAESVKTTFTWLKASNADSYVLYLDLYDTKDSSFKQILEQKNITGTSYTLKSVLQANQIYRWRLKAVNAVYSEDGTGINGVEGSAFMSPMDADNHPANVGMNFTFSGSISKEVLCNYLSRSIVYTNENNPQISLTSDEVMRFILNTGAKYIGRSDCVWTPDSVDEAALPTKKINLEKAHLIDSDIIFEACIFECVDNGVNGIPIPAWVFEAFGEPVVTRNFSYDLMIFQDGSYLSQWGSGASVPDMTRLETQMFFYYRACRYIDAGYEGLHMGQVHLIGKYDNNFEKWTKVLNMIRDYAKIHARRKFVLINAHTHGIIGSDGKLLFDFHSYPYRLAPATGSVAHIPTEDNPQRVQFKVGHVDSIYGKSLGGITHSGWSCNSLPYFVEVDNYWGGTYDSRTDTPTSNDHFCWGMDEISWFMNQPMSYRTQFLQYAYEWVRDLADDGFAQMPANRTAYMRSASNPKSFYHRTYVANNEMFFSGGFGDEDTIRNIWIEDNVNR